jgi:type I restriction enzyme S subunit
MLSRVNLPILVFGDHTRRFKYVDGPFAVGADGVKLLKPSPELDTRFAYWYLSSVDLPNAGHSRHFKFLKDVTISLPPLPEQRRIAEILDRADELRAKRRRALTLLDELSAAVFDDMFDIPSSAIELQSLPRLEDFASQITDGEHQTSRRQESGKKRLSARNIRNGYGDLEDVDYVDDVEFDRISKCCRPVRGDVLISCLFRARARARARARLGESRPWQQASQRSYFETSR